ncbi:hypothetical protein ROZALSC1DRAFT_27301 [Rozella allomycis CSF55]|uniref:MMS19 nucleotide excision repair protein n=1 Tax=Rozella allomycis (strain CSF55) TaxID=988480 RepID=A0A4P9YNH5_ROZAC|nr:hypothetical protein ROZALSC1DRAFT_27301 [Rozella allomycis CSF55]
MLERLDDTYCAQPLLAGIYYLLKNNILNSQDILKIHPKFLEDFNANSFEKQTRLLVIQIFECIATQYSQVLVQSNDAQEFIDSFVVAMDGEKDPEILNVCFNTHKQISSNLPLEEEQVENFFDVVYCYFPITFKTSIDDVNAKLLKSSLKECLINHKLFLSYLIPQLLDKIEADSSNVKVDVLDLLSSLFQTQTFPLTVLSNHLDGLINIILTHIYQNVDEHVEAYSMECFLKLIHLVIQSPGTLEYDPLSVLTLNFELRINQSFDRPESKDAVTSLKLLKEICKSAKVLANTFFADLIRYLFKKGNDQVLSSNKQIFIEAASLLVQFSDQIDESKIQIDEILHFVLINENEFPGKPKWALPTLQVFSSLVPMLNDDQIIFILNKIKTLLIKDPENETEMNPAFVESFINENIELTNENFISIYEKLVDSSNDLFLFINSYMEKAERVDYDSLIKLLSHDLFKQEIALKFAKSWIHSVLDELRQDYRTLEVFLVALIRKFNSHCQIQFLKNSIFLYFDHDAIIFEQSFQSNDDVFNSILVTCAICCSTDDVIKSVQEINPLIIKSFNIFKTSPIGEYAVASLVNKLDADSNIVENILNLQLPINFQMMICKGLFLRGEIDKALEIFSAIVGSIHISDIEYISKLFESHTFFLTKLTFCKIKLLAKQRFLSKAIAMLLENPEDNKSIKLGLISIFFLKSNDSITTDFTDQVGALHLMQFRHPTEFISVKCFEQFVNDNYSLIMESILSTLNAPVEMKFKLTTLDCLLHLLKCDYKLVYPHKTLILNTLNACLDHPKRLVRKKAVYCKTFLLLTDNE